MSAFTFACPVCHQHLKGAAPQSGSVMKCPTCFQRVVVPQPPGHGDSKLVLVGQKYVEKATVASPANAQKTGGISLPPKILLVAGVVAVLAVAGVWFWLSQVKIVPLANAGFETPAVADYSYNTAGAGWTFTLRANDNGSGITASRAAFTLDNQPAPEGVQMAFLQGHATFSQVVPGFVPGRHYTVSFTGAQRDFRLKGQAGQTWEVRVNGVVVGSFAPPQSATGNIRYSTGFTASTAVITLAFVGTDLHGGDNTVFIDDVQITSP